MCVCEREREREEREKRERERRERVREERERERERERIRRDSLYLPFWDCINESLFLMRGDSDLEKRDFFFVSFCFN